MKALKEKLINHLKSFQISEKQQQKIREDEQNKIIDKANDDSIRTSMKGLDKKEED